MKGQTAGNAMALASREWLEVIVTLPHGGRLFQGKLQEVEASNETDPAKLISLAYCALVVADQAAEENFAPWYREMAQKLLLRAGEAYADIMTNGTARLSVEQAKAILRKPDIRLN